MPGAETSIMDADMVGKTCTLASYGQWPRGNCQIGHYERWLECGLPDSAKIQLD